jgi:hypothetical protein
MQDANSVLELDFMLPPKTYGEIRKLFVTGFGGDALDKKIIAYAEEQTQKLGCFVAGTLVHTKEGLRPIEQVKVGDHVLSKPESGVGEASYKRVVQTYVYDDKEVWYLEFTPLENGRKQPEKEECLYVTPSHPFRVMGLMCGGKIEEFSGWVKVEDLLKEYAEGGKFALFELPDGRSALFENARPILKMANPSLGLVYSDNFQSGRGIGIDFSQAYPVPLRLDDGRFKLIDMDLPEDENYPDDGSIVSETGGFYPLLKKVYNLEVEDNHTYYVGKPGILVHNTSGDV